MKPIVAIRKSKLSFKNEMLSALVAVVPALILYAVFTICPLFLNMVYMLTDWNGMSLNYNFIGLNNFKNVFNEPLFLQAFWNTIYFAVVSMSVGTVLQLSLALMLYRNFKGKNIARAIFYIPLVISAVVMSLSWRNIFQYTGYINMILEQLHLIKEPIDWFGNQATAMNTIIFVNMFESLGVGIVLITAGLNGIPKEVNEAADLDGAHGLAKFFRITFPLIMPSLSVLWFMGIVGSLQIFDLPFLMTPDGGPNNSTTTITTLIYKVLFTRNQFGLGSAMGFVFFLFIATLSIIQLRITRKREVEL
ncbi:carbohydrate ABC transporter permease [Paenibacillus nasutitermitis]|uniref:Sugar ABC transporter permease n=1 Tax=Paenibacillus nasutitermitis TaxID=1652958 RepID=A0A916ZLJ7_9BACL|nr:sugar ABC transporter permease [Paenibacillus nasutitermitis]GGE02074.1 sugar ABC transporter permease [Paenibacillus nasutitermitis]